MGMTSQAWSKPRESRVAAGQGAGARHSAPVVDRDQVLADVVHRNIQALLEVRQTADRAKGLQERVADRITGFTGSMPFVYVHALLFGAWILLNLRILPGIRPWDPFPFVMLAMWASVEAIFLSTFVLISQNRMQAVADRRAELDLQISLLSEHEITRLITMVDALVEHLDVPMPRQGDVEQLKRDVAPERVLEEIEKAEQAAQVEDPKAAAASAAA